MNGEDRATSRRQPMAARCWCKRNLASMAHRALVDRLHIIGEDGTVDARRLDRQWRRRTETGGRTSPPATRCCNGTEDRRLSTASILVAPFGTGAEEQHRDAAGGRAGLRARLWGGPGLTVDGDQHTHDGQDRRLADRPCDQTCLSRSPRPPKKTSPPACCRPGTRLIEDNLMARFGAMRHSICKALSARSRQGIVARGRGRGSALPLDPAEVVASTKREMLQRQAALMIVLPADATLRELEQIQQKNRAAVAAADDRVVHESRSTASRHSFRL